MRLSEFRASEELVSLVNYLCNNDVTTSVVDAIKLHKLRETYQEIVSYAAQLMQERDKLALALVEAVNKLDQDNDALRAERNSLARRVEALERSGCCIDDGPAK